MTPYCPLSLLLTFSIAQVIANLSTLPGIISDVNEKLKDRIEVDKLINDVIDGKDMGSCSILILQDNSHASLDILTPFIPSLKGHHLGVSFGSVLETHPSESEDKVCKNVIVLATSETWTKLLNVSNTLWPGHKHTLLLILPDKTSQPLHPSNILQHSAFRFSVQIICTAREGSTWELYTTKLYSGVQRHSTVHFNSWTSDQGFRVKGALFPPNKLVNLEGYTFTVAALPYAPFIVPDSTSLTGPGKYRGLEVRLLDVLAKAANFTYRYVAPQDSQWGRLLKNGTWTGMIAAVLDKGAFLIFEYSTPGMVVNEEAEWAVSDITFSPQRERYVDFSKPFVYDASELVTPKAQPLPRWLSPIRPFRSEVWAAVGVILVFAGPYLWLLARICHGKDKPTDAWFRRLGNSVIYTIGPMFQRSNKKDIVEMPGRIFSGFWLLFTMIICISYSSSLTSFLIMPGLQKPIENLRQLVTSDIGWAKVYFGGVQSALLEETQDPVLVSLREGVQWRDSLEGILKEVVSGRLATWDNSITTRLLVAVKYTDEGGRPKVHFPGFELLQERIAWPMQNNAPYKKRLDELIDRVVQAGLLTKWLEFIIFEEQNLARTTGDKVTKTRETETETEEGTIILSLDHFQGPFFVLVLGFVAGGIILSIEFCLKFLQRDIDKEDREGGSKDAEDILIFVKDA